MQNVGALEESLIRVAQAEVQRMRAATLGQTAGKRIELPIEDFRRLADLVEQVCHLVTEPDNPSLGYSRYFVPIDMFRAARTRALEVEDECRRVRAARGTAVSIDVQPRKYGTCSFSANPSVAPTVDPTMSFAYSWAVGTGSLIDSSVFLPIGNQIA